jgi:hypothetical protein
MKKKKDDSHKIERSALPKKRRPTPAFDRAISLVTKLQEEAKVRNVSPRAFRRELARARDASRPVWRRAVKAVLGVGVLELPDFRQTTLGGGA